jgi:hypothetical protein
MGETISADTATHVATPMLCTLSWHYEHESTQLRRLHELAKAGTWNASTDIPWVAWPRHSEFPCTRSSNPLCGFAPYEALSEDRQRELSWWQHGLEISEILHGEQAALQISAQLVQLLPDMQVKLLCSAQVHDEARHVEFFARYLRDTVGVIHPPSDALRGLIHQALQEPSWERKLLYCQVLIESLALARMQELRRHCRAPALRHAVDYVLRDEARHVHFGTEYLRQRVAEMDQQARDDCSLRLLDATLALAGSLNIYTRIATAQGWSLPAMRRHLREYRLQHPELNRNRFRQLALNMQAVGLLTPACKAQFDSLNLLG